MFKAILGSFSSGDWYKHRNALIRIVRLRGGFETIDKEHLRITLTWYVLDAVPDLCALQC
jgi:hypothetical protein